MYTARSKIRFIGKMFIAIVMMASVYGCGGSSTPSTFTFRVVNNSGITVNEFYLSPNTSPSWGPDQFSADLLTGFTRDITGVAPCGVLFDYYAINGTFASPNVTWGPATGLMPPCGGLYTLTLN